MKKKSFIWFFVFFFLIILNLGITFAYMNKVKRNNQALKILEEIDRSYPSSEEYRAAGGLKYEAEVTLTDGRVANLKNFFNGDTRPEE